jgi:hypothetical protein
VTILPCQTRLKNSCLLTAAPDASISAISTPKVRSPSLTAALSQDSETVEIHHRGRGRRGELRAMIDSNIFKENHSFSN